MSKLIPFALREEGYPYRQIVTAYITDDGWTDGEGKEPEENIEMIDLTIQRTDFDHYLDIARAHHMHRGEWLTKEAAEYYRTISWVYRVLYHNQYINEMREYGHELQERYGVTELEAINILNGNNVEFYLNKYDRMKYMMPLAGRKEQCVNEASERLA